MDEKELCDLARSNFAGLPPAEKAVMEAALWVIEHRDEAERLEADLKPYIAALAGEMIGSPGDAGFATLVMTCPAQVVTLAVMMYVLGGMVEREEVRLMTNREA